MEGVTGGREMAKAGHGGGSHMGLGSTGHPTVSKLWRESSMEGEDCAMRPEVYWAEVPLEQRVSFRYETPGRDQTPG